MMDFNRFNQLAARAEGAFDSDNVIAFQPSLFIVHLI